MGLFIFSRNTLASLAPLTAFAFLSACGSADSGKPVILRPTPAGSNTVLRPAGPSEPASLDDTDLTPDSNEGPLVSLPIDSGSPDELLFQQALAQYEALNYLEAEQLFTRLVASYPASPRSDNAEYLAGRSAYALGIAQLGAVDQGALDRAAIAFQAVFTRFPDSPFAHAAHYYLGRADFSSGAFESALVEFQESASDPSATFADNAQYYVGRTYFELDQLDLAEPALLTLLRQYPNTTYADNGTYYLGRAQFGLQRYLDALGTFGAVSAFSGSIFLDNALYYHGRANYELAELTPALNDFGALLVDHPASGYRDNALYYRARIQADQGACAAAASTLQELSAAFPASSYVARTRDYLTQGGC